MKTVSALFETLGQAQRCISDLSAAGFLPADINLVANASEADYTGHFNEAGKMHDVTENVTEAGAAIGGLGGLVVGLSFFFIPGVGPVLAAGGLLASLISGAGLGSLAGGVLGTIAGLGVPQEDAHTYAEGIRRGGSLVVVQSSEDRADAARAILTQNHPIDVSSRASRWRDNGWQNYDETAPPLTREQIAAERTIYLK